MNSRVSFRIIVGTLLLSGCSALPSHFHDEKAATLSTQLQTEFAAYRQDQTSLYENLAANLLVFQAEEEELLSRFTANFHDALVTRVPTLTRKQLEEKIGGDNNPCNLGDKEQQKKHGLENRLNKLNQKMLSQLGVAAAAKKDSNAAKKAAEKAIGDFRKKIKKQQAEVKAWNKQIETYQTAIANLPDSLSGLAAQVTGMTSLINAAKETEAKVKSDKGLSSEDITEIVKGLRKVPNELKKTLGDQLVEAPGIAVQILELGLELAKIEKKRAESILANVELKNEIYEEAFVYTRVAQILLSNLNSKNKGLLRRWACTQMAAVKILERKNQTTSTASETVSAVNGVARTLMALRNYATAEWLVTHQETVLPVRLARLEHQKSITDSLHNDEAWQTLITSGLDSIVAYHKGGVTEEDIANIVRIAQGIALFIIAI